MLKEGIKGLNDAASNILRFFIYKFFFKHFYFQATKKSSDFTFEDDDEIEESGDSGSDFDEDMDPDKVEVPGKFAFNKTSNKKKLTFKNPWNYFKKLF